MGIDGAYIALSTKMISSFKSSNIFSSLEVFITSQRFSRCFCRIGTSYLLIYWALYWCILNNILSEFALTSTIFTSSSYPAYISSHTDLISYPRIYSEDEKYFRTTKGFSWKMPSSLVIRSFASKSTFLYSLSDVVANSSVKRLVRTSSPLNSEMKRLFPSKLSPLRKLDNAPNAASRFFMLVSTWNFCTRFSAPLLLAKTATS